MLCPVCREEMMVVEYEEIELDYCNSCRGVWFDAGEFELLRPPQEGEEPSQLKDDIEHCCDRETDRPHHCPRCRKLMNKIFFRAVPEVIVDSCPRGDGFWFEGGELSAVLGKILTKAQSDSPLLGFLGRTLQQPQAKGGST